jgi:hypothetical protein
VPESLLAGVYWLCAKDNAIRYIPVTNEASYRASAPEPMLKRMAFSGRACSVNPNILPSRGRADLAGARALEMKIQAKPIRPSAPSWPTNTGRKR